MKKLKDFLKMYEGESDEEITTLLDDLHKLSTPEVVGTREEYDSLRSDVFGVDSDKYYDVKEINALIDKHYDDLPDEAKRLIDTNRDYYVEEAAKAAKEYRPACLKLGIADSLNDSLINSKVSPDLFSEDNDSAEVEWLMKILGISSSEESSSDILDIDDSEEEYDEDDDDDYYDGD